MTHEIIILIILAAAAVAVAYLATKRSKANSASVSAPVTTYSGSGGVMPQPAPFKGPLTVADYTASFFGGTLAGKEVYPYKLPASVRGYGPGGAYDKDCFDPRAFDAASERIIGPDGTYVDVRTLTRHHADGSTAAIEPMTMRQWLYGLTIDPASVPKDDLLAMGMVTAPRAYLREHAYNGPGAFGGGA